MNCRNKCPYCNRGFNPDSLVKHLHSCPKKTTNEDLTSNQKKTSKTAVPNFFICGICGRFYTLLLVFLIVSFNALFSREYGKASIRKHLPQCYEQFQNDQALIEDQYKRAIPDLAAMQAALDQIFADGVVSKAEIQQQRIDAQEAYKKCVTIVFVLFYHNLNRLEVLLNAQIAIEPSSLVLLRNI